jgi:uroporphyrinogen-III synthase
MRVVVTRPEREAQRWCQELTTQGLDVVALPLIEVAAVTNATPLREAWQRLSDWAAVMFVSANAVGPFFAEKPPLAPVLIGSPAIKTRAWVTGPGTRRALLQAGVPASCIDMPSPEAGQFDSESLWQVVADQLQTGDRVLIVRGDDVDGDSEAQPPGGGGGSASVTEHQTGRGRDWLADQLAARGLQAQFLVAYQRSAPRWGRAERDLASRAADDGSVWLFSSSQAIANLVHLLPGQSWQQARAVATHPRIALAARAAGFGQVQESRPTLPDILASIESVA